MSEVDLVPVSMLVERYGLKRPALYGRFAKLGIEPQRIGRTAYVTQQDMAKLDQADDTLAQGGTLSEFSELIESSASLVKSTTTALSPNSLNQSLELVAEILSMTPRQSETALLVERLEALDKAAQNGWLLPSHDLATILGLGKIAQGSEFSRYGFVFHRLEKQGTQYLWRVNKVQ
ncbi:hypothetical protein [Synechococcus sp. PCC 6312]|uniref:hypothetical protein n=1 Tax=Synechococcus sp. (strain ATCC 27167 / PCC 6312) TaxID=195253 RepID=UPI00029EFD0F|nr:hypothetical protein [Synechococcus sp. PCC 6312]AFY61182.1 hypothetical protein Syn6312_2051 [Synechococcus sp. PCC 6312]